MLRLRSAARLLVRLTTADGSSRCSMNVSLYAGSCPPDSLAIERAAATSNGGIYTNAKVGVLIPLTRLEAGSYFVIPSTFDPINTGFTLTIYCDPVGALQVSL